MLCLKDSSRGCIHGGIGAGAEEGCAAWRPSGDIPFSSGVTLSKGREPTEMCSEASRRNSEGSELWWGTCCPEKSGVWTRLLSFQLSSHISPGSANRAFSGRVTPEYRIRSRAGMGGSGADRNPGFCSGSWPQRVGCLMQVWALPPRPEQLRQWLGPAGGKTAAQVQETP